MKKTAGKRQATIFGFLNNLTRAIIERLPKDLNEKITDGMITVMQ